MLNSEVKDAVLFEVTLAKILLNRTWAHQYTSTRIVIGKSGATVSGIIRIHDKHYDPTILRNDIRHQIAHLIAGVKHEHNFNWQFIARKLCVESDLNKLKAKEV